MIVVQYIKLDTLVQRYFPNHLKQSVRKAKSMPGRMDFSATPAIIAMYLQDISNLPERRKRFSDMFRTKLILQSPRTKLRRSRTQNKQCETIRVLRRVPAEILSKIFFESQWTTDDSSWDTWENWCWLTITHVCRQWRDVVLQQFSFPHGIDKN